MKINASAAPAQAPAINPARNDDDDDEPSYDTLGIDAIDPNDEDEAGADDEGLAERHELTGGVFIADDGRLGL